MSLRISLLLICLGLAIAGGELVWQSNQTAEWTDPAKAEQIQTWPAPDEVTGPTANAYYKRWTRAIDALRTEKWPLHDAGAALVMLGLCLAGALFALRIKRLDDIARLQAPRRGRTIFLIFTAAWFGYWASAAAAMVQGFDRFEFPTWGDTLVIPMMWMGIFALIGWVVLAILSFFVLRHARLPASLWIWRRDAPMHNWSYTISAVIVLAIAAEVLRETYFYGHWSAVPAALLWAYMALCYRAAGISKA